MFYANETKDTADDIKRQIVHYINNHVDVPGVSEEDEERLFTIVYEQIENLASEHRMSYGLLIFFNLLGYATLKLFGII